MSSHSSNSSGSSSSSGDAVYTGKSSLVFLDTVPANTKIQWTAILDLDALDSLKTKKTAGHYIYMTGSYGGYALRVPPVKVTAGARFVLTVLPRMGAAEEAAIHTSWREALLGRVRAALAAIRQEYDASLTPGDLPGGSYL